MEDVFAEIRPADPIEKILVGDVIYFLWEIWRLRRLQAALMDEKSYWIERFSNIFKQRALHGRN